MAIRTMNPKDRGQSDEYFRCQRKADQQWELAAMARQDGDNEACARHTANAREYGRLATELRQERIGETNA